MDAMLGQIAAAFEPDGQQQVQRHELRGPRRDRQVAAHKGRQHSKGKEKDGRHQQIAGKRVDHIGHVWLLSWFWGRCLAVRVNPNIIFLHLK